MPRIQKNLFNLSKYSTGRTQKFLYHIVKNCEDCHGNKMNFKIKYLLFLTREFFSFELMYTDIRFVLIFFSLSLSQ